MSNLWNTFEDDREMLDKSDLFYKVFEEEKYVFCDYYSQILKYQSEETVDFGWRACLQRGGFLHGPHIGFFLFASNLANNFSSSIV